MSSQPNLDDDLVQSLTHKSSSRKRFYEALFAKYERDFSENGEIESTDDGTDSFTDDEIETENGDEIGTEDDEDAVESASEMELQTILTLRKRLASSQPEWDFPRWSGEEAAPSSTTITNTTSAGSLLNAGHLRNNNSHPINVARHDVLGSEEANLEEALPGDREYVPEHHSTQGSRKRRRTKKLPTDQDLEQSAASSSIEDGDIRSQKDQPLCISKLKVAKTNQSGRPAGRAQRRTTTSKSSDQSTESDRDLEDKLASHRDVKVPCPRPECANQPTILYRTSRFSKKEESELIQHQRKVHDYSEFSCTVEGCSKRGGNGYYRQGNLVNHMKEKHELYPPVIIHDKLASRYDVKAPCPRPQCANHPTALYRVGRLPQEAESELIEHQRRTHDYSEYPCKVEGCPRQRGNGYFRQANLLKHLEKDHPPDKKILPNKGLYSDSEDELA